MWNKSLARRPSAGSCSLSSSFFLIRVGSNYLGALFVVVLGVSAFRYYINASVVLESGLALTILFVSAAAMA